MSDSLPAQPQPDDVVRVATSDALVKVPGGPSKITPCPACKIGVLYVIAYDPDASHEAGNENASRHEHFVASGGSQIVRCFNCGVSSSQPLNIEEGA